MPASKKQQEMRLALVQIVGSLDSKVVWLPMLSGMMLLPPRGVCSSAVEMLTCDNGVRDVTMASSTV